MQVQVSDIVLKHRIRNNLGDLGPLMESLQKHGLLNPITVTEDKVLIAGHRRLESAKKLGWTTIEARIVREPSETQRLEIEIDENVQRKSLTPDEVAEAYERLDKLRNPSFWMRLKARIRAFFARLFGRESKMN